MPGKFKYIHLNVSLFSNHRDNISFLVKVWDIFVPLLLHILGPCLLDWRTTGLWNVFLTVFQAPWHTCCSWKTLGTPLQCIAMCSFSPTQGTKSWLLLKFHLTRIWECDIRLASYPWTDSINILQPNIILKLVQKTHFCLFCCNTEATFCTVDKDCQLKRENGKEIPTLLIPINKVVSQINKVVSRINKVVSRIVEGVDPNQQGVTPNQQSVSRILYAL